MICLFHHNIFQLREVEEHGEGSAEKEEPRIVAKDGTVAELS